VRTTVIDPQGCSETNDFSPGDVWYFPRGHAHVLETLGDSPVTSSLSSTMVTFRIRTFSITDWLGHAQRSCSPRISGFRVDVRKLPKSEVYFAKGRFAASPRSLARLEAAAADAQIQPSFPKALRDVQWRHRMARRRLPVPHFHHDDGVVLEMEPGALRELHWHPNAAEWQYVLSGDFACRSLFEWRGGRRI